MLRLSLAAALCRLVAHAMALHFVVDSVAVPHPDSVALPHWQAVPVAPAYSVWSSQSCDSDGCCKHLLLLFHVPFVMLFLFV